jgi:hypothetical protein
MGSLISMDFFFFLLVGRAECDGGVFHGELKGQLTFFLTDGIN